VPPALLWYWTLWCCTNAFIIIIIVIVQSRFIDDVMQRERRLQQERLLNSFTTALNSFQSAQRKQKDREMAHRSSHSRRQPAFVSLTVVFDISVLQ